MYSTLLYTLRSEYIYPLWSYIAESGGWIGLFLGLSVIDVAEYFIGVLDPEAIVI